MPRIKFFQKHQQSIFLEKTRAILKLNWSDFAKHLGVPRRTLSDWRRVRYTISESILQKCIGLTRGNVSVPNHKKLPDFWSVNKAAHKGGAVVAQRYGGFGTVKGRKLGGQRSQERRRKFPERYQQCNLRKEIVQPKRSAKLAEFVGIVLGDGGITNSQVVISLHRLHDKEYVSTVCCLIKELFGVTPAVYRYRSSGHASVITVVISARSVVECLLSLGLKIGSKVRQQTGVPAWISSRINFSVSCLRGLIDTDGGVYWHRHRSGGHWYDNIGIAFSNKSKPIIGFVDETLRWVGFTPKVNYRNDNVYLYREKEVIRYADKIKFHNPYHYKRLNKFSRIKNKI